MTPNIDGSIDYGFTLSNDETSFTLGLKELIFLAFILFFGFCGFTVCVDKIYSQDAVKEIESVTVHNRSISSVEHHEPTYKLGYQMTIK